MQTISLPRRRRSSDAILFNLNEGQTTESSGHQAVIR